MLEAFGLGALAQSSLLLAGGLLAMLTNSLMPFATVVGFCVSLLGSS